MIASGILSKASFPRDKMGKVTLGQGQHLYAGLNCFEPGQEHRVHTHPDQDKLYYVLAGEAELTLAGEVSAFRAGDLAIAPAGVEHGLRNPGPERLVVLVVFAPPPAAK